MGTEIERKFLLKDDSWRSRVLVRTLCRQAYIHFREQENGVLRVRIAGEKGYLTLKGPVQGCTRSEYEYEIPSDDTVGICTITKDVIDKTGGPELVYRDAAPTTARKSVADRLRGGKKGEIA